MNYSYVGFCYFPMIYGPSKNMIRIVGIETSLCGTFMASFEPIWERFLEPWPTIVKRPHPNQFITNEFEWLSLKWNGSY